MKKLNKYLMLFVAAFALVGCVDDVVDTPTTELSAKVGGEVKFGVSLPSSRTIYDGNVGMGSTSFPIYWVENDKVKIFSPQALEGRNNAEYKVILPTKENSTEVIDKPNYAKDLEITGKFGVQWGEGDKNNKYTYTDADGKEHTVGGHDFYSVYPSGNYVFDDNEGESDMLAKGVSISNYQVLTHIGDGKFDYSMSNCLMTAYTPMDEIDYESGVVNLKYTPASTVLWVKLSVDPQDGVVSANRKNFTIQGVQLKTNTNIAGTFDLNLAENIVEEFTSGSDVINVAFDNNGNNYVLKAGEAIEFPIFLAPVDGLDFTTTNNISTTITINTLEGAFTKTFTGSDLELMPGKVHKVTLPPLLTPTAEWDVSKWMTYIPRNVYLSEISIPGSWNSLNVDAQGSSPSIETQYNNGIRAFHLDTRWKRTGSWGSYQYNTLGIAIGGDGNTTGDDGNKYMTSGSTFNEALSAITKQAKSDEYMVVICTFAQGSAHQNGTDGWVKEISTICAGNDKVYDAKGLTQNTLVGDVLGKVIVIINTEGELASVPSGSKCLFVNMPMTMTAADFTNDLDDRLGDIEKGAANSSTASSSGIQMYHTHAQATIRQDGTYSGSNDRENTSRGFIPTRGERLYEVSNIINWSATNYGSDDYGHNKWIYLGLGGYYVEWKKGGFLGLGGYDWNEIDDPTKTVASDFNTHINSVVTAMDDALAKDPESNPYYPVGIVLMNYANDYKDTAVKNILKLNNKYRLQYDPNKSVDYNPNSNVTPDSGVNQGGTII